MPTNEERRKTARKLSTLAERHDGVTSIALEKFLGLVADDRFIGSSVFTSESVKELADLIEPEPERTCKFIRADKKYHSDIVPGGIVHRLCYMCSICGEQFPCDDVIDNFKYCPNCGAKVVL